MLLKLTSAISVLESASDVQLYHSNVTVVGRDHHIFNEIHVHEIKNRLQAILEVVSNYRKIQQDTLAKATPGTILWLLEGHEFRLFIDVDGQLKFLWGSGMRS